MIRSLGWSVKNTFPSLSDAGPSVKEKPPASFLRVYPEAIILLSAANKPELNPVISVNAMSEFIPEEQFVRFWKQAKALFPCSKNYGSRFENCMMMELRAALFP